MTSERDPRVDPRPGDVLRRGSYERKVLAVGEWAGWTHAIRYKNLRNGTISSVCRTSQGWRRWANTAEVTHHAGDVAPDRKEDQ